MRRRLVSVAAATTMLVPAGCGASAASSPSGTTAPPGSATPTATGGTGTGTTTSTTPPSPSTRPTGRHHGSGRVVRPGGPAAKPSHRRGAGAAATAGSPFAPAGLTPTTGYGTYERCQGACTGSVPDSLRRSLSLPAADGGPCPVTLGPPPGPVSVSTSTEVGFAPVPGSDWPAAKVTWTSSASYRGPLLIRGRQIGGPGAIGFGDGQTPYDELQLLDAGQGAPADAGARRSWVTYSRVRSSGCYAYQIDGTSFSEVIVFRAVS